ncbi:MAG TPA: hypothetical protein ENK41_00625 [Rhodobacteraceae bacterium]|nr:hypothetical protein [Paracoccaceae bacterium]
MARPGRGTLTARVWEEADRLEHTLGRAPYRFELCRSPNLADIHPKTVDSTYGNWKRATHPELTGTRYLPLSSPRGAGKK